jgi:hypothetical protein
MYLWVQYDSRGCLLNACRGKHTLIILLEDGTLGAQEGDGDNNSFSLGTGQWTQSLNGKKKKKKKEFVSQSK